MNSLPVQESALDDLLQILCQGKNEIKNSPMKFIFRPMGLDARGSRSAVTWVSALADLGRVSI